MKFPHATLLVFGMSPYEQLAKDLFNDGIRCQLQTHGQMVVSRQEPGPIWPNRGNSFWVTYVGGTWHLFTWSLIGYRVPGSVDVVALCRACMAHGDSAMPEVPADIAIAYGLVMLSAEETEAVYRRMGDDEEKARLNP